MYETYFPEVVQAIPLDDFRVRVYFNDGKIVEYDMTDALYGPAFEPLRDPAVFRDSCCVMNETLAWDPKGLRDPCQVVDIDPLVLHALPDVNDVWANRE